MKRNLLILIGVILLAFGSVSTSFAGGIFVQLFPTGDLAIIKDGQIANHLTEFSDKVNRDMMTQGSDIYLLRYEKYEGFYVMVLRIRDIQNVKLVGIYKYNGLGPWWERNVDWYFQPTETVEKKKSREDKQWNDFVDVLKEADRQNRQR